ncbi:MAG: hypothetical protein KC464_17475, partial [Myxococcales bacterium]|nr:hypothetical protein [Myxococcales bacterium]
VEQREDRAELVGDGIESKVWLDGRHEHLFSISSTRSWSSSGRARAPRACPRVARASPRAPSRP